MSFTGFTPAAAEGADQATAPGQEVQVGGSQAEGPELGSSPFVPVAAAAASTEGSAAASGTVLALSGSGAGLVASRARLDEPGPVPATYADFKGKVVVEDTLARILQEVGVEDDTEMANVACIAESEWTATLDRLLSQRVLSSALQRAKAVRGIRSLLVRLGMAPPGLGAPMAAAPPAVAMPVAQAMVPALPMPGGLATPRALMDDMHQVSLRDYLDQSMKGTCPLMDKDSVLAARALYESKVDHKPRDNVTPSVEQLSCLLAILRAGRTPYVDFGVWNTFGPRLARFQDYDAQVIVQGQVVTKRIAAPSSMEGWLSCWALFEVAMVSLGAASLGALRAYSDGLQELATLFPGKWPVLVTTDLIVRSERWGSLKERFDRAPPVGYDPRRPWSYVISTSAWGSDDQKVQQWWQSRLVLPAAITGSVNQAAALVSALDGGAVPAAAAAFPIAADRGRRSSPRRRSRTPPRRRADPANVCRDYNLNQGKCNGKGACHANRFHECIICGDRHRGIHHHDKASVLEACGKGKGKGKHKGKKGAKGDKDKKKE